MGALHVIQMFMFLLSHPGNYMFLDDIKNERSPQWVNEVDSFSYIPKSLAVTPLGECY